MRAEHARRTAGELHAKVRLGQDPAGEKFESRAKAAETLGAVLRQYLYRHVQARQRPRSFIETTRHLNVHCLPLHGLQITKIDRRAVASRLGDIAAKSGSVTSNRVSASLSAFFSWAIRQGLAEINPVIGTGKEPEQTRDRVLTDPELVIIWRALADNDYGAIIKLLMLTGQRAREIAWLHWSEVQGDEIALPSERTKNAHAHRVPITKPVAEILACQVRRNRDLVFGRSSDRGFAGWTKSKSLLEARIREMTGADLPHWTPHDLRRTAATRMAELGIAPHVIEAVLNHRSGTVKDVGAIYNRYGYDTEKRAALTLWGDHVLELLRKP
jgi:integrase